MTDADFMKLPVPVPTLQLETATSEELAALRVQFPQTTHDTKIGELDYVG